MRIIAKKRSKAFQKREAKHSNDILQWLFISIGIGGSHHFTAPEVIRGDKSGKPVDVWAMGVLLYIMLSGQTPFFGTKEHLFNSILRGAYSVWYFVHTCHFEILFWYRLFITFYFKTNAFLATVIYAYAVADLSQYHRYYGTGPTSKM